MSLRHQEVVEVHHEEKDEDIEVWNFLNVNPAYQFRGGNPTMETFHEETDIYAGGTRGKPVEYISEWVADELWHELGLDNLEEMHGIEVIDLESDTVQPL